MKKDFDSWNTEKKILDEKSEKIFYHEREIWWCSLGLNVGYEQDGTGKRYDRPVIIVWGFSPQSCIVVPLTGCKKEGKYYFYLGAVEERDATAILSQIKNIDTRRLLKKIGMVPEKQFLELTEKLQGLLFP